MTKAAMDDMRDPEVASALRAEQAQQPPSPESARLADWLAHYATCIIADEHVGRTMLEIVAVLRAPAQCEMDEEIYRGLQEAKALIPSDPWAAVGILNRILSAVTSTVPPRCSHSHARLWMYRDDDTWMICPDCSAKWVERRSTVPSTQAPAQCAPEGFVLVSETRRLTFNGGHGIEKTEGDGVMDPTSRGDELASRVRRWYEANRETWWQRHSPFGSGPDRSGTHADEFMLRFISAVGKADEETPR